MSSKKYEQKLTIHSQYDDILILHKPRRTMANLIRYISQDPHGLRSNYSQEYIIKTTFTGWKRHHIPYLISLYLQIYSRNEISKLFKYDPYIDQYYAQIPSVAEVQRNYRPYLHHVSSQFASSFQTTYFGEFSEQFKRLHIYMNIEIAHGPILTLSMPQKDLLIFGYINRFKRNHHFYAQIIPWDVLKIIHSFFDTINKEYLEMFNDIKQNIIEVEAEIQYLKTGTKSKLNADVIHQKQSQLLALYNKTKDIRYHEEFEPLLLDKYVIDTKQYQLTAEQFASEVNKLSFQCFQGIYDRYNAHNGWWSSLQLKHILFDLLKMIVPTHSNQVLLKHKTEIEEQLVIYEDYIQLCMENIRSPFQNDAQQIYNNITKWMAEMFSTENEWTRRINQRVHKLMQIQKDVNGFASSDTICVRRAVSKTGRSFTVD